MQKTIFRITVVLLFVLLLLPFGILLAYCLGYTVTLARPPAYGVVTALIAAAVSALSIFGKQKAQNFLCGVLFAFSPLLALFGALFYFIEQTSGWAAGFMLMCMGLCCFLAMRHGKTPSLKVVSIGFLAVLLVPAGYIGFVMSLFGNIGQVTVVRTLPSPEKTYYAEVIDDDQGALGGTTLVWVYEYGEIDLGILEITKKPRRIYRGDWGEYKTMEIYWGSEEWLVINGRRYGIP